MNSRANDPISGRPARAAERSRKVVRHALRMVVTLLLAASAYAQYGGGGTMGGTTAPGTYAPSTPGYGNGKAIGIGVGAAAAGAGAIYFLTHRAAKVTGCVEAADDGLRLTDDKSKRTLTIVPGAANVSSGERVQLKGKIKKNSAGDQSFLVKSVAKDFGQCPTRASAGKAGGFSSQAK